MKGTIYNYDKPLPKKLHRWFIGYYVEENFDTKEEAEERIKELRSESRRPQLYTRENAMPPSKLRK